MLRRPVTSQTASGSITDRSVLSSLATNLLLVDLQVVRQVRVIRSSVETSASILLKTPSGTSSAKLALLRASGLP